MIIKKVELEMGNLKKEETRKFIICAAFLLFGIYLLLQHSYVDMYFDDYGYASLTYGWTGNTEGTSFGISTLFHYLIWHYMNHGGRILAFFFEISIFRIGGLALMQIIQAVVILAMAYLCFQILKRNDFSDFLLVLLIFTIYGTVGIRVARDGIYWYSASIYYLWAFLPFLLAIYLEKRDEKQKILIGMCCFAASFSQEQMAIFCVSFFIGKALFDKKVNGTFNWYHKISVSLSIIGAAIEILAPGNFVRAATAQTEQTNSFLVQFWGNISDLADKICGHDNIIFMSVLTLAVFCVLSEIIRQKWLITGACLAGILFLRFSLLNESIKNVYDIIFIPWFIISICLILCVRKKYSLVCLMISAFASQIPMLIVNYRPERTQLMFELAIRFICVYIVMHTFVQKSICSYISCATLLCISVVNLAVIFSGYKENDEINQVNRGELYKNSEAIRQGEDVHNIILYKLKNDLYANAMPYISPHGFMIYWVKEYYDIPQEVNIEWIDYRELVVNENTLKED